MYERSLFFQMLNRNKYEYLIKFVYKDNLKRRTFAKKDALVADKKCKSKLSFIFYFFLLKEKHVEVWTL